MANQQSSMHGKVCLVTGSNSGLGRDTAAGLAGLGASVVLACRNIQAAEEAAASVRKQHPGADVVVGPPLDLAQQSSIREFVEDWERHKRQLHVLVNNAGAHFITKRHTAEDVPLLCQVNYLGAYTLTRLLEPTLISSTPSRVVNVSSILHRASVMSDATNFLKGAAAGQYRDTKLANVLHAFEVQRRLGPLGVQFLVQGLAKSIMDHKMDHKRDHYANLVVNGSGLEFITSAVVRPARWTQAVWQQIYGGMHHHRSAGLDSAQIVIHAATANLLAEDGDDVAAKTRKPLRSQSLLERERSQLRFYARGAFATKAITSNSAKDGLLGGLQDAIHIPCALFLTFIDWPVRNLSAGKYWAKTLRVPAAPRGYDAKLARALWDQSASIAQLPANPTLPKQGQKGQQMAREPQKMA